MKILKFNQYQIQSNHEENDVCTQCCVHAALCYRYGRPTKGPKYCTQASSATDCANKSLYDFGIELSYPDDPYPHVCGNFDDPVFGGMVDDSTTATCYFDEDGDGCLSVLTCRQMEKPQTEMTECDCKNECEGERGGEFSPYPPADPRSPCAGIFINGKCGTCENTVPPPSLPPPPPGTVGPPSPPSPPSPPPPPPPPSPPPSPPPGGPSTTCPTPSTLEVESGLGFDPFQGQLTIYNPNDNSSFNVNYEYLSGNVFINIVYNNANHSILEGYIVTQNNTVTTSVRVGVISYVDCGLNENSDLICCPEGWSYANGKCCPPT